MSANLIKVDESDNVAIVVNEGGLPSGSMLADGLTLLENVPQGHKVALCDIRRGMEVRRYGQAIGYATLDIRAGSWVDEPLVDLPEAPDLKDLELRIASGDLVFSPNLNSTQSRALDEDLSRLGKDSFLGFPNPDGGSASRNLLGLVPTVQCVAGVLLNAAQRIEKELLPRFPNVDGVVALNHAYGCGSAVDTPYAEIPVRTLSNLAIHPNFGGQTLVVGLGCEMLQPELIAPGNRASGIVVLQNEAGYAGMMAAILREAEARLEILNSRKREPRPLSELVVGLQCGGSDAFSGVTANPAIGYAADLLVRAGATVMFSEVTEVRDGIDRLVARATDARVATRLIEEMRWYDEYLERGGVDRSANPAPGNKKGGLANIVEKALGSMAKSGSSPITGVLGAGERGSTKGMIFAATPASDFICGTEQLASGIHVQVFSTGRGTPYGLAMAPVIKVASRSAIARAWLDLFDVDAGKIAEGRASMQDVGREIFRLIIDAASGRYRPWADRHGIRNDLTVFNPGPIT